MDRTPEPDDDLETWRRALEGVMGIPFSHGNKITPLRNGDAIFPAMLRAIEAARESICFLTFVYWKGAIADRFARALADAARRGVEVYVLLDAFGAAPMDKEQVRSMADAGVQVAWFRPLWTWRLWRIDHRTHRKILVCDGDVGFTGGVGIAAEWEGDARNPDEWRDTHFKVEGPAVHPLRAAFLGNWLEAGRPLGPIVDEIPDAEWKGDVLVQVIRAGSAVGWSDIATLMRLLIVRARRSLRITTAYFVPDQGARKLLCEAVGRGVEVDIMIPGQHIDKRFVQLASQAEFGPLLEAGVRLWRYQRTMLHAKVITADDVVGCIGSANFNQRSMRQGRRGRPRRTRPRGRRRPRHPVPRGPRFRRADPPEPLDPPRPPPAHRRGRHAGPAGGVLRQVPPADHSGSQSDSMTYPMALITSRILNSSSSRVRSADRSGDGETGSVRGAAPTPLAAGEGRRVGGGVDE